MTLKRHSAAPWSGDRSPKRPASCSDSKPSLSPSEVTKLGLNMDRFDTEKPYWCTFLGCCSNFSSKNEWRMHEEEHWAPGFYICLLCTTVRQDSTGYQKCIGCSHTFDPYSVHVAGSHMLQCELARERAQKFASYDYLCTHLRTRHDVKHFELENVALFFPTKSNWPRECGFCGAKFAQWERRVDHIGAHFVQGESLPQASLRILDVAQDKIQGMADDGAFDELNA